MTQDLEEQIEEYEENFEGRKRHFEYQIKQLKQTINELEKTRSGAALEVGKNVTQLDKHQDSDKEKRTAQRLVEKIHKIYNREKRSGGIQDSRLSGLQMMTYIESRLELLMTSLAQLDPEKVEKKMRERDR